MSRILYHEDTRDGTYHKQVPDNELERTRGSEGGSPDAAVSRGDRSKGGSGIGSPTPPKFALEPSQTNSGGAGGSSPSFCTGKNSISAIGSLLLVSILHNFAKTCLKMPGSDENLAKLYVPDDVFENSPVCGVFLW